jgi:hypothetical protein
MPRGKWSQKRERQYAHIKGELIDRGDPKSKAEEIAARTVNKARARAGESMTASRTSVSDLSSSRRGGLRSHKGRGGEDPGAAVRGGPATEHQGSIHDVKGSTRTRRRSLRARQGSEERRATRVPCLAQSVAEVCLHQGQRLRTEQHVWGQSGLPGKQTPDQIA